MKLLVEIPDIQYNNILAIDSACLGRIPYKGIVMYSINAIKNGQPLPENYMIIDKGKLEFDADYDAYYDGYTAYSQIALEAAEIGEQE